MALEKKVEEALHKSEEQFRALADSLPQLVWTTTPSGEVEYYNQPWKDYTGYSKEHLGWGWTDVLHPEEINGLLSRWQECRITGKLFQYDVRMRCKDGIYRWHSNRALPLRNEAGEITRWFGTCTDIQELKETEEKLRLTTEQLNLTLRSAHIGTFSWDLVTAKVTMDDKDLELLGIDKANFKFTVSEVLSHIHPDDHDAAEKAIKKSITDCTPLDTEYRSVGYDKTIRYLAMHAEVVLDDKKHAIRMFGVNWDITARKKLEDERLSALQSAEEQGRRRAEEADNNRKRQEEFIDTICHEIRNPLNGIYGSATLLREHVSLLKAVLKGLSDKLEQTKIAQASTILLEAEEQLEVLDKCAEQQKVIVDDALDLSKLENNRIELANIIFDLKEVINSVIQMFQPQAKKKNLRIELNISDDDDVLLKADYHRLSQVLINLISNAIKFTKIGIIKVEVSIDSMALDFINLHIAIEDSGIGMTQEEVSRIFNRFSQASHKIYHEYGGSGLGLAISKKLVEVMGGTIGVESKKSQGSRFTFYIKCMKPTEKERLAFTAELRKRSSSHLALEVYHINKNILIVEDNEINQKILMRYLEQKGCFYQVANNGAEALDKCKHFKFDLIFMDIEMPVMDGIEATKLIREHEKQQKPLPKTPIIGLSGNARREQIEHAMSQGMDGYLTKPYHKENIYKIIAEFIEKSSDTAGLFEKQTRNEESQHKRIRLAPSTSAAEIFPMQTFFNQTAKPPESHVDLTLPNIHGLQNYAKKFKQDAADLLKQNYSFQIFYEDSIISIQLPISEPHFTAYLCNIILQNLKEKLIPIITAWHIETITVIDNSLIIIGLNLAQMNMMKQLLKAIGIGNNVHSRRVKL